MKNTDIRITIENVNETTLIYLQITENKVSYAKEYSPGLIVDYDKNNEVVGVEVIK